MKKEIRKIALSSLFSSLIAVLIIAGSVIEVLDITIAALCTLAVYVIDIEAKGKYPFLVYLTSSVLCLIFVPMTTATLYFVAFFGYYPILKKKLSKLSRRTRKIICTVFFNIVMLILMLLFKAVFALQNEPAAIYIALLVTCNIFFICFDYILDIFHIIYIKKLKSKFNFKL